jgi:hypothetical protein
VFGLRLSSLVQDGRDDPLSFLGDLPLRAQEVIDDLLGNLP